MPTAHVEVIPARQTMTSGESIAFDLRYWITDAQVFHEGDLQLVETKQGGSPRVAFTTRVTAGTAPQVDTVPLNVSVPSSQTVEYCGFLRNLEPTNFPI